MRPDLAPDHDSAIKVDVRPVGGRRSGVAAWIAAGVVGAGLVGLVTVGRLGVADRPSAPARTLIPTAPPVAAVIAATPGLPVPTPPGASGSLRFRVPRMGYDVILSPGAIPTTADEGRVVMFALDATDAGSTADPAPAADVPRRVIVVATGTPAKGAEVSRARPSDRAFATTLAGLEEVYRTMAPGVVASVEPVRVDGVASRLLHVKGFLLQSTWVLLAVTGGRSYVISARAFPTIDPGSSAAATRAALIHFLDGVRFGGPPLYANPILGFEVTTPVDDDFTGYVRDTGPIGEANGTITFHAGVGEDGIHWSHSITVAVGSSVQPAPVIINATRAVVPLWAPSLGALVRAYSQAVSSSDYTEPRTLGGEPALYYVRPGGVGAAVVAVHRGRVYIISSSGTTDDAPAGQFRAFLDSFRFLD